MAASPSESPDDLGRRLLALEERFAFLERTLEELSEVVRADGTRLDDLTGGFGRLSDQLDRLRAAADADRDPDEEKPPHY